MSVMSSGRCLAVALAVALSASACAKAPPTEKGHKEPAMSEDTSQSRTVDGYTYTTAPVVAQLGPHRYAFPANFYDDQIGPSVGGGIALSFIWPGLQAAAPGDRPTRSMEDHYRTVTASIDYLDAVAASELLPRLSSTEATTEAGSVTREVRLEREEKATHFHPDDPYRQRIETPKVVLNDLPGQDPNTRLAALRPGDAHYPLYQQIREHVAALDAKHGRSFDETSERLTASLTALAVENKLDRADHVVLSQATAEGAAGRNVFVVQGNLHDPAQQRAAMATEIAVQTPVEQSLQRLDEAGQERQVLAMQTEQRTQQNQQELEARSMRMG